MASLLKLNIYKQLYLATLLGFIPLVIVLIFLLGNINKGIDITDEGFYISYSVNADQQYSHLTHFAHYTGLVFKVLANNLVLLRIFGVLTLVALTLKLYLVALNFDPGNSMGRIRTFLKSLSAGVVGASVLCYYYSWLPTPSYNWLALVGCLFVTIGLVQLILHSDLSHTPIRQNSYIKDTAQIAFGFLLLFMAKPSTALCAGILCFVWLSFHLKSSWLKVNIAIACFTLIFFALHILIFTDGFFEYYELLAKGLALRDAVHGSTANSNLLTDTFKELQSLPSRFANNQWIPIIGIGIIILVKFFTKRFPRFNAPIFKTSLLAIVVVSSWSQLWLSGHWEGGELVGSKNGYAGLAFSLIFISAVSSTMGISKSELRTFSIIILMPMFALAFSFGSTNGLLRNSTMGFVYYALACVLSSIWYGRKSGTNIVTYVALCLIFASTISILYGAFLHPYRLQSPLSSQQYLATFMGNNTKLYVDRETAKYIRNLKTIARSNGWTERTHLIDMTGGTPAAAYILNGNPLGAAWLIGGYEGSANGAYLNLSHVASEKLETAWILTAPQGSRSIPLNVLSRLDLRFNLDYVKVGELVTGHRQEVQYLWKPQKTLINHSGGIDSANM